METGRRILPVSAEEEEKSFSQAPVFRKRLRNLKSEHKTETLTLTAALALTTLTACGNGAGTAALPETSGTSTPLLEESGGTVGTVLLSVNPEIEMDYNDVGNVVALTGRNQEAQTLLASYTGYEGRPWATSTPPWAATRRTSS